MLHDILSALLGVSGDFLYCDPSGQFQVKPSLQVLHPTENALLVDVCAFASYYNRISQFVEAHRLPPAISLLSGNNETNSAHVGLYLTALATGIDSAVVAPYIQTLSELEASLLRDQHLGLAHILFSVEPYRALFDAVFKIISTIDQSRVFGIHILDLLYQSLNSGYPQVEATIRAILQPVHHLFAHQLLNFLFYGILFDPYSEFFLQTLTRNLGSEQTSFQSSPTVVEGTRSQAADSNGVPSSDNQQFNIPITEFTVNAAQLPNFLTERLILKIQFVGEARAVLQQRSTFSTKAAVEFSSSTLLSLSSTSETGFLESNRLALTLYRVIVGRDLTPKGSHTSESPKSPPKFHFPQSLNEFEMAIDAIKRCVSRRLYALLVEEHQLPAELILLKSLFLLGSGELYRAVLDALEPVLASRPALLVALLAATAAAAAPSAATSAASASSRETPSQSQAQTAALALHTELEQCFRFAINYVGPSAFGSSLPGCKTQSEDELYDMLVSKFNFVYTNPTITPLFTIESGSGNNSSLDPSLAPLFNLFAGLTIRYRIRLNDCFRFVLLVRHVKRQLESETWIRLYQFGRRCGTSRAPRRSVIRRSGSGALPTSARSASTTRLSSGRGRRDSNERSTASPQAIGSTEQLTSTAMSSSARARLSRGSGSFSQKSRSIELSGEAAAATESRMQFELFLKRVLFMRQQLTILLNNLEFYLFVDVFESEFTALFDRIRTRSISAAAAMAASEEDAAADLSGANETDFELLCVAFETCVLNVFIRSFLQSPPILRVLSAILQLTLQFARASNDWLRFCQTQLGAAGEFSLDDHSTFQILTEALASDEGARLATRIGELDKKQQVRTRVLVQMLRAASSSGSTIDTVASGIGPASLANSVAQFLLRLDLNSFYSSSPL